MCQQLAELRTQRILGAGDGSGSKVGARATAGQAEGPMPTARETHVVWDCTAPVGSSPDQQEGAAQSSHSCLFT